MKRFYETLLLLIGTLGWWGFVYPELSAVTESCGQEEVQEETEMTAPEKEAQEESEMAAPEKMEEKDLASFVERLIRNLGSSGISNGDVRIKSRVAEYLYQEKEKEETEKESGYEEQECTDRGVRFRSGRANGGKGDYAPDAGGTDGLFWGYGKGALWE